MSLYYEDDLVSLHLANCLEELAWLEADVLVSDPPFGRAWRQGEIRGHVNNAASSTGIANDHDTGVRDAVLTQWGGGARPVLMFGDLMLPPPPGTKLVGAYRKPVDAGIRGAIGKTRRDLEAIYWIGPGWGSGIGGRSSLYATAAPLVGSQNGVSARSGGHPHAKPLDVMEQLLTQCPPGTIADPFAGSGSTLIAARNLGRRAIGVEIHEPYAEIAARRLAQTCLDFGA